MSRSVDLKMQKGRNVVSFSMETVDVTRRATLGTWSWWKWSLGIVVWMMDCVWKWAGASQGVQKVDLYGQGLDGWGWRRSFCSEGGREGGDSSVGGLPRGGTWSFVVTR